MKLTGVSTVCTAFVGIAFYGGAAFLAFRKNKRKE